MNVAESNLSRLAIALVVTVVVVGVGTFLTPWSAEYEVKTFARIACNDLIKLRKYKLDDKGAWEQQFVRKCIGAGVKLKPNQYAFEVKDVSNEGLWRCRVKVAWRSSTPWLALSAVFPEAPPLEYVNRVDKTYDVMNSF